VTETIGGRYRVLDTLGVGGMGAVLRVHDERDGRELALKRMRTKRSTRRDELRFQREFHTLTSLAHPRIVEVYDYGIDDEGPYYTMQLLEGSDLRDLVRERRLSPGEVCRLLRDVASALAALHARGLIHRDLSPRNVRVIDGHAVLFDFGVLVDAGWVGDVAGTPAFVAPEMLRGVPIDGRADLYSLGVLGYSMLTGERPYDARALGELEDAWRRALVPPSEYATVPEPLEDLILDLLCLEPLGRPPSAAVLIDKLTALGDLDDDPALRVTPTYVHQAALVGRDAELDTLLGLVETAAIGRSFYVEAQSGAGKSRLLQEMAIQSKLEGLVVLPVSCEEAEGKPFGVLAAALAAAFEAAPEEAREATAPEAPVLARVFEEIREAHPRVRPAPESGEPAEDRMQIQLATVRTLAALARARTLVLLIDDVQRCDEASAAALASLAHFEPEGMVLGIARRLGEPVRATAAVEALSNIQTKLRLAGLDRDGVEALLRSLFGDVANLSRLARWMHEITGGSPLYCAEVSRSLIERQVVRYAEGTWIVPEDVPSRAPTEGLAAAMRERVGELSDAARRLGEVLALHGGELALERIHALAATEEVGADDLFEAIGELQAQGVLADRGDALRFRHDSLREALREGVEPARRRRLHRHVGEVLHAAGVADDPASEAEVGRHLYRGGDEARGAAMLERAGRRLHEAQALADAIEPLELALEARREAGAPDAVIADLSYLLLSAGWVADRAAGARHAEEALELHGRLAGLHHARRWRRVVGWRVAVLVALAWAYVRWGFRSGEARGATPLRALSLFAVGLSYATALAYSANRKDDVWTYAGRAEPFRAFRGQPPFAAYLAVEAMGDILCGRLEPAATKLTEANRLVRQTWLNPMTDDERRLADAGSRSMRVVIDVNQFHPRLFDDLEALEQSGLAYYHHVAQSIRMVRHRYRGEEDLARALEDENEAESLALGAWSTELQRLLFAHPAYAFTHDVAGLKRCLDALERRVAEGMELSVRVDITRAEILRERGEFDEALAILEPLLERLDDDDHLFRQYAASAAAQAALEAYAHERAAEHARRGLAEGEDLAHRVLLPWLRCQRVLALADAARDRADDAARRLEEAIELAEARDCPVLAGELHEARARVALAQDDRVLFELHRGRCAHWLRPTENPGLIAVVERLYDLDREGSMRPVDPHRRRVGASSTVTVTPTSQTDSAPPRSHPGDAATVVELAGRRRRESASAEEDEDDRTEIER